jgi:hypothetical protein
MTLGTLMLAVALSAMVLAFLARVNRLQQAQEEAEAVVIPDPQAVIPSPGGVNP